MHQITNQHWITSNGYGDQPPMVQRIPTPFPGARRHAANASRGRPTEERMVRGCINQWQYIYQIKMINIWSILINVSIKSIYQYQINVDQLINIWYWSILILYCHDFILILIYYYLIYKIQISHISILISVNTKWFSCWSMINLVDIMINHEVIYHELI